MHPHQSEQARLLETLRYSEFAEGLKLLEGVSEQSSTAECFPERLPLASITKVEAVFQARSGSLSEHHLTELGKALRSNPTLEPVTVWRCGSLILLVDGHHRYEAYRRHSADTGVALEVPVAWFSGTARAAAIEAGKANSRAKLPMSPEERCNHAWRLVLAGGFKVDEVIQASAVCRRTVQNMRKAKAKCEAEGIETSHSWRRVLATMQGRSGGEWHEDQVTAEAERLADRLAKFFSTHLATNPTITARAFDIHFGRKGHAILREWMEMAGEPVEEDDEEGDF